MTLPLRPDEHDALIDRDQEFFDALTSGDSSRLESLLAESFLLVGVDDGAVVDRDTLLEAVRSGGISFPEITSFPSETVVRVLGEVGIVLGRTHMQFTGPDGTSFGAASRYVHVFHHESDGRWRLVSAQGTKITNGVQQP